MSIAFVRCRAVSYRSWLNFRRSYLTASDAARAANQSPFGNAAELWDEKTGRAPAHDISNKPYVIYGKAMEPLVREQMLLELPYFSCEYHQYDLLISKEYPFLAATLDGELTVTANNPWGFPIGAKGVYEGKTGSFRDWNDLERWYGSDMRSQTVPVEYWIQGLQQLLVTGWDFVIYGVRLKREPWKDEDVGFPEIRSFYRIMDRRSAVVQDQISNFLIPTLSDFYFNYWKKDIRPSAILRLNDEEL